MSLLKKLNFKKNWIYEVLILTWSQENQAQNSSNPNLESMNIAPFGISTDDFVRIKLNIYKSARTCKLIMESGKFTVKFFSLSDENLEEVMMCILKTYKKDIPENYKIDKEKINNLPGIRCRVEEIHKQCEQVQIISEIEGSENIDTSKILPVNRASHLFFESLVKFTKLNSGEFDRNKLYDEISENHRVIKKVAPGSPYLRYSKVLSGCAR